MQEARLKVAMDDLNKAQSQLDAKQAELDEVQALYDAAMAEKEVCVWHISLGLQQWPLQICYLVY